MALAWQLSCDMDDGQASQTARRVAAQRRHFDRLVTDYGDPAADQRLHDDVAGDLPFADTAFTAYLAMRTRFFDDAVVDAIARGVAQIVVAGAGYDGRSLRYANPTVRWFELDHPATVADKASRLARLGISGDTVTHIAIDFSMDDVGPALDAAGHDARQASLFYCEGVTPYLDQQVVARLLAALHSRAATGSGLAIDFALRPESEGAQRNREALRAVVESHGEPFRFELAKDDLATMLGEAGWQVTRAIDPGGADLASSDRPTAFVRATPAEGSDVHGA
jgi:methyltransferase (TIGR00027 family)